MSLLIGMLCICRLASAAQQSVIDNEPSISSSFLNVTLLSGDLAGKSKSIPAIPAVFGKPLSTLPPYVCLQVEAESTDGCGVSNGMRGTAGQECDKYPRYLMLSRGGCPFENKALEAQRAGFDGLIIRNRRVEPDGDIPVRMVANHYKSKLEITSMFCTYSGFEFLFQDLDSRRTHLLIVQITDDWDWKSGMDHWHWTKNRKDLQDDPIIFFCVLVILLLSFVVLAGLARFSLAIYLRYGSFSRILRELLNGTLTISMNADKDTKKPKLTSLGHIPTSKYVKHSTCESPGTHDSPADIRMAVMMQDEDECCPICIDEFVEGCIVRKLPCGHTYHNTCIDPWLMNHTSSCPICKRDLQPLP